MANTTRTYTSDGIQTIYPVDFTLGFIHRDYVYIHLESDVHTTQLSYSWIDDSQIQLDTPVASTVNLVVSRVIPRDILVNDYEDGAILRGKHLDESNLQHLMLEEEGQDASTVSDATLTTLDNKIDAEVVTLNTRIDTEVTTLDGRIDTEVATLVAVDENFESRLNIFESGTFGDTHYIHWLYNDGSATGGETTINIPYDFTSVATVFINGVRMTYGLAFEYNVTAKTVTFAEALDITDEVVVSLGTEPVQDYSDLVTDVQLAEIQDLSQAYEFDTGNLMKASVIVFPVGKILVTKGFRNSEDGRDDTYLTKTEVTAIADGDVLGGDNLQLNNGNWAIARRDTKNKVRNLKPQFGLPVDQVRYIGHKGGEHVVIENTLQGFSTVIKNGFKEIEMDVQVTSDGVLVCFHDATVDLATDGTGAIKDMTLAQVRGLRFTEAVGSILADVQIPIFTDVLEFAKVNNIYIWPEIKYNRTINDVDLYVNAIEAANMVQNVCLISALFDDLTQIRSLTNDIAIGKTSGFSQGVLNNLVGYGNAWYHLPYGEVISDPTIPQQIRAVGVGVVTFTLGNQVDVKNAKLGNSNAFTSDYTFGDLL